MKIGKIETILKESLPVEQSDSKNHQVNQRSFQKPTQTNHY